MTAINFFTPISNPYEIQKERCHRLRFCEQLFNFGQRSVHITKVSSDQVEITDDNQHKGDKRALTYLGFAIKAALIATLVLPAMAVFGKCIYRKANHFCMKPSDSEPKIANAAGQALDSLKGSSQAQSPSSPAVKKYDQIKKMLAKMTGRFIDAFFRPFRRGTGIDESQFPLLSALQTQEIEKTGIANQGNSCWLNSMIQSMLSSRVIVSALDEMIKNNFSNLKVENPLEIPVIKSFSILRQAMRIPNISPRQLGRIAAQMRNSLFKGIFSEYQPKQKKRMHDPGVLYLMLLKNLGLFFPVTQTTRGVDESGIELHRKQETQPNLLFLDVDGTKQSIQSRMVSEVTETSDTWKSETGNIIPLRKTTLTISGKPPPVLVVQLKSNYDAKTDRACDSYQMQQEDLEIDIKEMLPDADGVSTKYRLISFAQNQDQVHWVAFGMEKNKWRLFNDSYVSDTHSVIGQQAHYCIYERID